MYFIGENLDTTNSSVDAGESQGVQVLAKAVSAIIRSSSLVRVQAVSAPIKVSSRTRPYRTSRQAQFFRFLEVFEKHRLRRRT